MYRGINFIYYNTAFVLKYRGMATFISFYKLLIGL